MRRNTPPPDPERYPLGRLIWERRRVRNLTMSALAKEIDRSDSYINDLEHGAKRLSDDEETVRTVAHALRITARELRAAMQRQRVADAAEVLAAEKRLLLETRKSA